MPVPGNARRPEGSDRAEGRHAHRIGLCGWYCRTLLQSKLTSPFVPAHLIISIPTSEWTFSNMPPAVSRLLLIASGQLQCASDSDAGRAPPLSSRPSRRSLPIPDTEIPDVLVDYGSSTDQFQSTDGTHMSPLV